MCLSCLNQHNKFRTTNTTNWSLSLKRRALPPPSKHKRSNLGRYILFQQFSMQSSISAAGATWGLEFCSKFLIRFMANQIFFTTWCKMSVMMISSKASLLPKKCQNFQTKFQAFNQFTNSTWLPDIVAIVNPALNKHVLPTWIVAQNFDCQFLTWRRNHFGQHKVDLHFPEF